MYQIRRTHIDHLPYRPPEGFVEPKKDMYGRISFRMPEVRSLSALEFPMKDDPAKPREKRSLIDQVGSVKVVF